MNTTTFNRIDDAFKHCPRPLFIPYVTAGHPSPDVTVDLLLALEEAGSHIIELGVPHSDPLADGPTIQASSAVALKQGVTLSSVLAMGKEARERGLTVPLILFTYVNPVFSLGVTELCKRASAAGFDGLIVPDLPYEESGPLEESATAHGLSLIPLVAPTSDKRIQQIVTRAKGFVYCVSSLGTTGARDTFSGSVTHFLDRVRSLSPVPIAVGFGISKAEHVKTFAPHVDAVVVGSALIDAIEAVKSKLTRTETKEVGLAHVKTFVRSLKNE